MNSAHEDIGNACITCHMASPIGYFAGGHTWIMEDEEEGFNTAGCLDCHTADEALTLTEDLQVEVEEKLLELQALLETAGIYNPANGLAKTGTYTNAVAGAYWNYISIEEDKSLGVHNPRFVKKLLDNTIASIQ